MHEAELPPASHLRDYTFAGHNGFIDDWLVAGPSFQPIDLKLFPQENPKPAVANSLHAPASGVVHPPLQFAQALTDDPDLKWRVEHCGEDHFIYGTGFHHTPNFVQVWAYAVLETESGWRGTAALTTNGPADVWLDNQPVFQTRHFAHQIPQTCPFDLSLQPGQHALTVRFACVALRESPMAMALQLQDCPSLRWLLPTPPQWERSREELERIFQEAFLVQDTFAKRDKLQVSWPEGKPLERAVTLRLERPDGRIYSENRTEGKTMPQVHLGSTYQFPQDDYVIRMLPDLQEFYTHGRRVERRFPVYLAGNLEFSREHYGTYRQRRLEALQHAAREEANVFGEIAKMELGLWNRVKWDVWRDCLSMVESRADCSDFYLVGLLGACLRYGEKPEFDCEVKAETKACVLGFRYWLDEPGQDAMCFWSENHQILFHCCEVLAGQLYPEETFTNSNLTGGQHQKLGETRALSWLRKRAGGGFKEWDSNTYFEEDVLALTHLADLAVTDDVHEMATVVLDKLFLGMAVNSFQGVFGSTHGRSYAPLIKGGFREATSGISRLLWGMGIWNRHVLGIVSLACAENYRLPPLIEALAQDPAPEIWSREKHAGILEEWCDLEDGDWEINKVTYKTPDYMLASAQDYTPGQPGYQQHIWQATFSPAAVLFVTHPPCLQEDGAHRPNFWHGNVRLPRVAQFKDVLIALHDLGENDWLNFTHAYFPTYAFDSYYLQAGWAFAMIGEAYLALRASTGAQIVLHGDNARRELRAAGPRTAWILQLGRKELDGSFRDFRDRVRGLRLEVNDLQVTFDSLRGDTFKFGWDEPFRRNGTEVPLSDFPHYDSPYSQTELQTETMDIQFQDLLLRLHLQ